VTHCLSSISNIMNTSNQYQKDTWEYIRSSDSEETPSITIRGVIKELLETARNHGFAATNHTKKIF